MKNLWNTCGALVACIAAASGCGSTKSPTAPAPAATVTSISVTSPGTGGSTFQLTAIARMSDSTTLDVTRTAAWDSSNTQFATVSAAGVVTVQASGEIDLRATYGSVSGSLHAVVVRIVISSLIVTGASHADGPFQLTATARWSDGSTVNVTNVATWDSSNPTNATVSSTGVVNVESSGEVDIRATYQGVSDSWHLSVRSLNTYELAGSVAGTDGLPIEGVGILILDLPGGGNPAFTDASGLFTFPAIEAGTYLIEVSKNGYQTTGRAVTMLDRDLRIAFTLLPAPSSKTSRTNDTRR